MTCIHLQYDINPAVVVCLHGVVNKQLLLISQETNQNNSLEINRTSDKQLNFNMALLSLPWVWLN